MPNPVIGAAVCKRFFPRWSYRSLKCDRTRIHRNLFLAIIIYVIIQLVVHIDLLVAKTSGSEVGGTIAGEKGTIFNTVSAAMK